MRQITSYPSLSTEDLINELAEVTQLLKASLLQQATAQAGYDKEHVNSYYMSQGHSVAEKNREADYNASLALEDLTEFNNQVQVHTVVRDFLTNLINWRMKV